MVCGTAWFADAICAQKPKGFGRDARIEGHLNPGDRVLLVEDGHRWGSKISFVDALRDAKVEHCFVIFFYDIFPQQGKFSPFGITTII